MMGAGVVLAPKKEKGACMPTLTISDDRAGITCPPAFKEVVIYNPTHDAAKGVLGRIIPHGLRIEYYPRWWYILAWPLIRLYVIRHERGHAWGIPMSGCVDANPRCVMWESPRHIDVWREKMSAISANIGRGQVTFCRECLRHLEFLNGSLHMMRNGVKEKTSPTNPIESGSDK